MDGETGTLSGFDPDALARVPGALSGVIESGDLSGAVTLIWRKGEIAQLTMLGKRDIEKNQPMELDTLFRIASMTKPITSVAMMMLIEEGKAALGDPITQWAPEFANMKVLKDAQGPVDDVYDSPRDITLDDLFTHRAGLAYGFTSIGPIAYAHQKALGDVLNNAMGPDAWLKALASVPLSYPPGERFPGGPYLRDGISGVPVQADLRAVGHGRHRLLRSAREARPRSRGLSAERGREPARAGGLRPVRDPAGVLRRGRRPDLHG
jgi:CubicO group peptidase (beta-lactamase class C family)